MAHMLLVSVFLLFSAALALLDMDANVILPIPILKWAMTTGANMGKRTDEYVSGHLGCEYDILVNNGRSFEVRVPASAYRHTPLAVCTKNSVPFPDEVDKGYSFLHSYATYSIGCVAKECKSGLACACVDIKKCKVVLLKTMEAKTVCGEKEAVGPNKGKDSLSYCNKARDHEPLLVEVRDFGGLHRSQNIEIRRVAKAHGHGMTHNDKSIAFDGTLFQRGHLTSLSHNINNITSRFRSHWKSYNTFAQYLADLTEKGSKVTLEATP